MSYKIHRFWWVFRKSCANKIEANGYVWNVIKGLNNHFDILGYVIIGIFMASWIISVMAYKYMQLDELESKVKDELQ